MEVFEFLNNLNEVSHHVGEHGNTDQEDERADEPLEVAPWVEVPESNSRQGREGEVESNYNIQAVRVILETIVRNEGLLLECLVERILLITVRIYIQVEVINSLAQDEPEDPCKISDIHDHNNQIENLEDV